MIGIYKIENKINGKVYIGQSIHIKKRWYEHKYQLNSNCHCNTHLQLSWNKYGQDNFTFVVIETCQKDELDDKEMYWIEYYKSYDELNGYNISIGGQGAKLHYDIDLIINTYNETNSVVKTSELLNISEEKISEILNNEGVRIIEPPNRKVVGLNAETYELEYIFNSIKEAYENFNSLVTNQINKSIKDSKYIAFGCIWFDYEDYKKYSLNDLLKITKYNDSSKYDHEKLDDISHEHKTKVICITTGKIFNSVIDGARYYGINSENGICYCCKYKRNYCGKYNNNKLQWMYLDEYETMINNNYTYEDMKKNYIPKNTVKRVVCLNTREVFNSIVEANIKVGLSVYSGKISECCMGKAKSAGKLNGEKLFWVYYEEYINMSEDDILNKIKSIRRTQNGKSVICLETLQIFDSMMTAIQWCNLKSITSISECCTGQASYGGRHPETNEPLHWMFYEDYKELESTTSSEGSA